MKNLIKSFLIVSVFALIATSCSEDKEPTIAPPVIKNLEVGGHHHDDEKGKKSSNEEDHDHEENVGHIGEDLHIEAEIEAEGKIAYIMVEIHKEGDAKLEVVEQKFTEGFAGLKNTKFHKHVDIPAKTKDGKTVTEGDYHFHIKVVDQQGKSTEEERDIKLENEKEEEDKK